MAMEPTPQTTGAVAAGVTFGAIPIGCLTEERHRLWSVLFGAPTQVEQKFNPRKLFSLANRRLLELITHAASAAGCGDRKNFSEALVPRKRSNLTIDAPLLLLLRGRVGVNKFRTLGRPPLQSTDPSTLRTTLRSAGGNRSKLSPRIL